MKRVEKWKWRIKWGGRWTTTTIARTEEDIRVEHPEAEKVPGTMVLIELPETEDEVQAFQRPAKRTP